MSASWVEIAGLLLGGGAVGKFLDVVLFRDQDAAALRREMQAQIEALSAKVDKLEVEVRHWAEFAVNRNLRCVQLMLEVNDILESIPMPARYASAEIFAPLPQPPEKD